MAKKPTSSKNTTSVGTKRTQLILMLSRANGASLAEMVEVTKWQAHTVRAALTGLKKTGHTLASEKVDGVRRYSIVESKPE